MPTYHIKLRDYETSIDVPSNIHGLRDVAEYITRQLAHSFALSKKRPHIKPLMDETEEQRLYGIEQNYYDSHLDVIMELLTDMKDKLRSKHGEV